MNRSLSLITLKPTTTENTFFNSYSIVTLDLQNTESNLTSQAKDTEIDFAFRPHSNQITTNQITTTFFCIVPGIKSLKITVCLL